MTGLAPETALRLLDESPACWVVVGSDGTFRYVNRAAAAMLGRPREELVGTRAHDVFPEAERRAFFENIERVTHDGRVHFEEYFESLGAWLEVEAAATDDGVWAWFRDTTDFRRREESLRLVFDQMPPVVWTTDASLQLTTFGGGGIARMPTPPTARVGRPLAEFLDEGSEALEAHTRALLGESSSWEHTREGRYYEGHVEPKRAPNGDIVGTIGMAIDVTDRLDAQEELRASEQLHRLIVESAAQGIWLADSNDKTTFVNQKLCEMLGYEAEELLGRALYDLIADGYEDAAIASLERRRQGKTERADFIYIRADGSRLETEGIASPLTDADGRYVGSLTLVTDVSERRLAQQTLAESEQRFRAVFDGAHDAMLLADDDRRYVDVNDAACRLLGRTREELLTLRSEHVFADGDTEQTLPAWKAFLETGRQAGEFTLATPEGGARHVSYSATANVLPGLHLSILRDVTDRRELEEQLLQSQKMETVGRLAGGMAHDFNNLLTAIAGYAELAAAGKPEDERRELDEVLRATDRAAALISQLLAFSRRQVLEPKVLDLNAVVRDLEAMLQPMIGERIELVSTLDPSLSRVRADPNQLQQVIVNLAVNARDAMPDGGRIALATRETVVAPAGWRHPHVPPGTYAVLEVADGGHGMSEQTRAKIFEPFFTTKAPGAGTGLGLSTVYGIVTQSGGHIAVDSTPGSGTTFTIYLPATTDAVEEELRPREPDEAPATGETVLLVEDEDVVRELVRELLHREGYRVVEAVDPESALASALDGAWPIDLLLTDVVMPGMSGPELAEGIIGSRGPLKVLYMSGYADDAVDGKVLAGPGTGFLQKPFDSRELKRKVRALLDAEG